MLTNQLGKRAQTNRLHNRQGAVTILVVALTIIMFIVAVFAIDYGYILVVKTDLQRAADHAALAAVQDIVPNEDGYQDLSSVESQLQLYTKENLGEDSFSIAASDIETGRFDPSNIYSSVTLLSTGVHDTVRVTLRRDDLNNTSVSLFFARLIGINNVDVSATSTAVLQKARYLTPGTDILPIAIPEDVWNSSDVGEIWSVYGNGRILDSEGDELPGNWGTLDVGATSNSTSELVDQINNGLRQEDLDFLADEGAIPDNTKIDSENPMWLSGDTGLSSGMKSAIQDSHGETKLVPIFDQTNDGNGGNLDFHVVGWGVVKIVSSQWRGNNNSSVVIQKTYTYDGDLRPQTDLSNTSQIIEAAYTSPILVQ